MKIQEAIEVLDNNFINNLYKVETHYISGYECEAIETLIEAVEKVREVLSKTKNNSSKSITKEEIIIDMLKIELEVENE